MPAVSPSLSDTNARQLSALGERIRLRRKQLKVSAIVAAESVGMSRLTWHRVERGEPSVTMGAYVGAANALGLSMQLMQAEPSERRNRVLAPPEQIELAHYPQLAQLAWHLKGASHITAQDALNLYERNWRHVEPDAMDAQERELLQRLVATLGGGRLFV
jgi:transcriptional regulator with XRE-family HTH domain